MPASVWKSTLAEFFGELAAPQPAPAGVAAAAITARFGIALLIKALTITRKKTPSRRIDALIKSAQRESAVLARAANDDIEAVRRYMKTRKTGGTIKVPLRAVKSALRGFDLCAAAVPLVRGPLIAEVAAASALLIGSARAMLVCVADNLKGTVQ